MKTRGELLAGSFKPRVRAAIGDSGPRQLLRYPLRQRWRLLAIMALTGLSALLAAVSPLPLKVLVDYGFGGEEIPALLASVLGFFSIQAEPVSLVVVAALAGLSLALIGGVLDAALDWEWETAGQRMVYDLAADLFSRLQRLSLLFHTRQPVGDSLSRLTVDSWSIYTITDAVAVGPFFNILTLLTVGFAAWRLDPGLAALSLTMAPVLALSGRFFSNRLKQRSKLHIEAGARFMSFVQQTLSALPLVQAFNAQDRNRAHFSTLAERTVRASQSDRVVQETYGSANGLITTAGTAVILLVGARQVLAGAMPLGTLLVFLAYIRTLESRARGLLSLYGSLRSISASIDRVVEVLDSDVEVRDPVRPVRLVGPVRGHVRLEGVTFGYEAGVAVLEGVSVEARPGETVALVGRTGAGKTTLVSLIPRFFDPWEGRVTLDGVEVGRVGLHELRGQVGLVRQEPLLLPLTVAENIAYGRPGADREEIEAAAVAANADEFIRRLPDGYESVLGERGATLSGGERQRLAIARALLKDAPVLILDEPTSALDAESETLLFEALERLMEGRTTFLIAHRLSTVRHANLIVVLDQGRIVETGTHQELLTAHGLYHHLHTLQIGQMKNTGTATLAEVETP